TVQKYLGKAQYTGREARDAAREALRQRVVELHGQGLSQHQIATELDLARSTVASYLRSARPSMGELGPFGNVPLGFGQLTFQPALGPGVAPMSGAEAAAVYAWERAHVGRGIEGGLAVMPGTGAEIGRLRALGAGSLDVPAGVDLTGATVTHNHPRYMATG